MRDAITPRELQILETKVENAKRNLKGFPWPWKYWIFGKAVAELSVAKELEKVKYINLCRQHQQEPNRSHFAEHNCDYCKLLNRVNKKGDQNV